MRYNTNCCKLLSLHRDKDVVVYKMAAYPYASLKFHSDWNWIMEVIEAIEKLDNFYFQIEESACYVYDISKFTDEQCNPLISCDLGFNSKKEAVVQAIDKFLEWYFNNKQNIAK